MVGATEKHLRSEIELIGELTNKAFDNGRITSIEILYPFVQSFIKNEARTESVKRTLKFFKVSSRTNVWFKSSLFWYALTEKLLFRFLNAGKSR